MSAYGRLSQFSGIRGRVELKGLERGEISQAELAWWKRPGYIGSIAPILIALVGFLSVWSTGFFETQRAKLKNEIVLLETEQKELSDNNRRLVQSSAEIQKQIDQAYLSIKLAIADASYAFGHLRSTGPPLTRADHERAPKFIECLLCAGSGGAAYFFLIGNDCLLGSAS